MPDPIVIQLPTVFPSGPQAKGRSGPFRGIDLLDAVYGFAERPTLALKPCLCGAVNFLVDERWVMYCPACKPSDPYEGSILLTEDELAPEEPLVRVPRKGNRDRWFQFFANRWWELDHRMFRSDPPVTSSSLIAKLDRLSKRQPAPAKPMFENPKPFILHSVSKTGLLVERPVSVCPSCNCLDEEMHDAYPDALSGVCPLHGVECATCGEDHFHTEL